MFLPHLNFKYQLFRYNGNGHNAHVITKCVMTRGTERASQIPAASVTRDS